MPDTTTDVDAVLHEAARIAAEYIAGHDDPSEPVLRYRAPEELRRELSLSLPRRGRPLEELLGEARRFLSWSVRTGHPRFFNQLFAGYEPAAILGEWMVAVLNTSMYTYEVAPVATLVERELLERMNALVGFESGDGVLAPGGSHSNLLAVLAARHRAFPHVKREGLRPGDAPALFHSAEAHYSLNRAASVAGIGLDGAFEIPVDGGGRLIPAELERAVEAARAAGRRPFLISATAGTTSAGAFDPIAELAEVAARHDLWLHVDACYGGSALFSRRHRHLLEGIERADSVSWNPHKMMGVPLPCSAVLMREKGRLLAAFSMKADYLFHDTEAASWDLGDLTLQCGRRVDGLKLWMSWQAHGDEGFERRVDGLFELAASFADAVRLREGFRLIREPQATAVCFRYLPAARRHLGGPERDAAEHRATVDIRERMLKRGRFFINYCELEGAATFRIVVCNARTTSEDLEGLMEEIELLGED